MKTDTANITAWVQETLNELYSERLIPFELIAHIVSWEGREYVVSLHDSRLNSVRFSWTDHQPFKEVVRAAVLDRVERIGQSANAISPGIQTASPNSPVTVPITASRWLDDRVFSCS